MLKASYQIKAKNIYIYIYKRKKAKQQVANT